MYDYPFFYITEKPNNLPAFPQKKALNVDRNNSNNTKPSSASRHLYMYKLNILGIFSKERERDTPSFCVANCALVIYIYNILYIQIIASANWGKHW